MGSKMLIDASHSEETRVVVVRGNRIEEFDFESASRKQLKGNIYLAKVTRVEPSLQAAFIEYGGNRHGFLAFSEIHPDYYQIPVADRQALIKEQEEEEAAQAEADDDEEETSSSDATALEQEAEPELTASVEDTGEEPQHSDEREIEDGETAADEEPQAIAATAPAGSNEIETVEEGAESRKVDSVGAEDALEEVPQRARRTPRRHYKIQEVIKRRQIILVQVVKEERGNKGAALTTYLSLAGRYCVLMPNTARGGGISRKITDAGDRRRLKEVARDVEIPKGMGLIVRTAGAQRTRPEIKRDFDYLIRLWENVRDLTLKSTAPALVYEEGSLIKRSIRDLYTKDVEEVQVEGDDAYREAKDFMKMLMPSHAKNVKLYKDNRPLFSRSQVETQLDSLYSPTVTLPSGGYIVMNQTEALVSVDINSGKATREHNIEDTALKTNLEACDEIARQLRLRDLAGLVVIDFIDMEENRNNRSVERRLKEALKNDRARIQVGRISHFGLMEMSRQRLRPGLLEGSSRPCPHCEGRGIVRSISSCGLSVLRAIEDHLQNRRAENLTAKCAREVASYVLNEKRDNLLSIEQSYGISVFIVASDELKGSQALIERAGERAVVRRPAAAPVKMDSAFEEADDDVETEEDAEVGVEAVTETNDSEVDVTPQAKRNRDDQGADGRAGKRRRRGRRGGRRGGREGDPDGDQRQSDAAKSDEPMHEDDLTEVVGANEVTAASGDMPEDAEVATPRETDRPRRSREGRGRDRGRKRERSGSRTVESEARPASTPQLEIEPDPEAASVPAAVSEIIASPAEEARRWKPPAPTVPQAAEGEPVRKSGWWSRRG
jgi:ribonuclease E